MTKGTRENLIFFFFFLILYAACDLLIEERGGGVKRALMVEAVMHGFMDWIHSASKTTEECCCFVFGF